MTCEPPWGTDQSEGTLKTPPECESPWSMFDYGLIVVSAGFAVDDFIVLG